MKLKFFTFGFLILILILSFSFTTFAFAQSISSTELINNAKQYDGKSVVYKGEVIGDVMERGEFAWVNLNDGQNAIGIWVDKKLSREIIFTGNYKSSGDIIEVEGVFHRSCLEHGGDLDIHAGYLKKIKVGVSVDEKPDFFKKRAAVILLGVLCLVLILHLLKRG